MKDASETRKKTLKRSRTENEPDNSSKKSKVAKKQAEENSEGENGDVSENGRSESPAEKPAKVRLLDIIYLFISASGRSYLVFSSTYRHSCRNTFNCN